MLEQERWTTTEPKEINSGSGQERDSSVEEVVRQRGIENVLRNYL